jgi:hypothetical protein
MSSPWGEDRGFRATDQSVGQCLGVSQSPGEY